MTDDQQPCDEYSENLAELALGILTGRARAATLAHVDSCAHCAEELEQLSRAADAVVSVAPELEPSVGFEVRLFNRMGLADDPAPVPINRDRGRRGPRRWVAGTPRWALASAAAVVALLVGLSVGWSIGSPSHPTEAGAAVTTAALKEHGSDVGSVVTYGGSTPWMIVTMDDSSANGRLTCEVVTDNGVTHKIGTFSATYGYAAWDAPLRVAPQDVQKAEVVSSNGTVIATASLS
jgi:anti-sigma-K factor RskA